MAIRPCKALNPSFSEPYTAVPRKGCGHPKGCQFGGGLCVQSTKRFMEYAFYFLLVIYLIINTFCFRFQRTTLSISRALFNKGDHNVQAAMTPTWVGTLGWLCTILWLTISALVYFIYGWPWALLFFMGALMMTSLIDFITPWPSYKKCFHLIKKELTRQIAGSIIQGGVLDAEKVDAYKSLLKKVNEIEKNI